MLSVTVEEAIQQTAFEPSTKAGVPTMEANGGVGTADPTTEVNGGLGKDGKETADPMTDAGGEKADDPMVVANGKRTADPTTDGSASKKNSPPINEKEMKRKIMDENRGESWNQVVITVNKMRPSVVSAAPKPAASTASIAVNVNDNSSVFAVNKNHKMHPAN